MSDQTLLPPVPLPGFEDKKIFWEPQWKHFAVKVLPGEFYVSKQNMVLTTVLGSCISACIYDAEKKIGGMNHFMLPATGSELNDQRSMRYGLFAMEQLINELMKLGCLRHHLRVKLTGGGDMLSGMTSIGQQNIDFVLRFLKDEKLTLVASDLGGSQARKVAFFPTEGRMMVNKLDHRDDQRLIEEERSYRADVDQHLDDSDVELF